MAVEEVDLCSQRVYEARSAFVDIVMTTSAAEQFGARRRPGDLKRRRDGRNGVGLGDDEKERDPNGSGPWHRPTPGEPEQGAGGDTVVP